MLLSGGADHSVRLWAVTKNSNRMFEFSRPLIHGHVIKKVFFDPITPFRVVIASCENAVRVLDATSPVTKLFENTCGFAIPPPTPGKPERSPARTSRVGAFYSVIQ
ncbi:hypothetical protein GEMRC1_012622 [Eukaryota sp. GEM-RC1]